nr:MAG TPA: hypothetical protein [Caudoviricetes sp.]
MAAFLPTIHNHFGCLRLLTSRLSAPATATPMRLKGAVMYFSLSFFKRSHGLPARSQTFDFIYATARTTPFI